MSCPSGKTDPREPDPIYVYLVYEEFDDFITTPTPVPHQVPHLRGVFMERQDAIDTARNRIYRANPSRSWALIPQELPMMGKELYIAAVAATEEYAGLAGL
ncbi:MAG: hypothetical protein Q9200_001303 [Gallowayella weberi]